MVLKPIQDFIIYIYRYFKPINDSLKVTQKPLDCNIILSQQVLDRVRINREVPNSFDQTDIIKKMKQELVNSIPEKAFIVKVSDLENDKKNIEIEIRLYRNE